MRTRYLVPLTIAIFASALSFYSLAEIAREDDPREAVPPQKRDENGLPFYEKVLETLLEQQHAVSKPLSNIHPFRTTFNDEAPIPPQCYTKTDGQFNPCYVCHQDSVGGRENKMADGHLQLAYSFSDVGMTNHWENLFEDRTESVASISDDAIVEWVNQDNYSALAGRLDAENFSGWMPDLKNLHNGAEAFREDGFAKDGSHWVAFNYKPFPSTFWPTNGSTDDVMIRLAEEFRNTEEGKYSEDVYKANLAIVEATVKGLKSISSLPVDEANIGTDLNGDGKMSIVEEITELGDYVGAAKGAFKSKYMYPKGTEFLHTVRYLGFDENGDITVSKRMKEVRYMKKWSAINKTAYERGYQLESFAKEAGRLPRYAQVGDWGLDNGYGWSVQGFIEAKDGELRTATYEENLFCMGCHTSVGATIDKTFSFPRKVDGKSGWGYINLKGMPDAPNYGETKGEIATYLSRVGGGGEFRSNPEMFQKWFNQDGTVNQEKVVGAKDVYELITPSRRRALELNKAYRLIVDQQDFLFGRDATAFAPKNVYRRIDNETAPTLPAELFYKWDIRLAWPNQDVRPSNKVAEN